MQFFRSDAFSEAVEFGRDVLVDRPRRTSSWPDAAGAASTMGRRSPVTGAGYLTGSDTCW